MQLKISITLVMAACLGAGAHAADGNAEMAKGKISMCIGCHGVPDYKTAFPSVYNVPKLGGQHPQYIVAALKGYKRGERSHPTMRAIAESLSEQDMADLAAYYGDAK